ncbi:hypothetical protein OPKNFCMD_4914 [Methylobacterium crusticola]|uniref:Acyltransferase 3 domain-containing protein n=1 Tax=Methylobacterium crusticola TaxID=1697972 RepID=A0ABQ4R3D4_9HYPH|nr:acyltransferase [Methylobacterium crusticola]GJD52152.1 hypothetical protein OPKNFCMD_4914 [Methylobacterium crusticola]
MQQRWPLLDYVRLIAASSVIFSHAFLIAEGSEVNEPLVRLLGPHNIVGIYGVFTFFIISGFLVTLSAKRTSNVFRFMWHRAIRIYPALFACLLITSLIIGSMFTVVSLFEYLSGLYFLKYTVRGILYLQPWSVSTVVFYTDPGRVGEGLNGSLWTIRYELMCYALVALLHFARCLTWPVVMFLFIGAQALLISGWPDTWRPLLADFFFVCPSFLAGALLATIRQGKELPAWPMLACASLLLVGLASGTVMALFPLIGAYPIIRLATFQTARVPSLQKFGDISYGMYLFGWPLEQMIRGSIGMSSWWAVFVPSIVLAALCGYASWHLIEKHALKLKDIKWPHVPMLGTARR